MNREYHSWWSSRLNRTMEILVFGHAGAKVLVFPTRGGRFYEYENLRMIEALRGKIEEGAMQLFCLDGIDSESFYCFWAHPSGRIRRHIEYEEYILNEVFPFMHDKNPHACVIAHGCSLGAYQAANIAFRHPHLFRKLAAFSGRYDLTRPIESFPDLFDGYYSEDIYFHTPTHYLPNLNCEWRLRCLREMDIVLAVGERDPFRPNNENLSGILHGKGVSHQLHVWGDRAHSGYAWRRMAAIYI
jgi:esterase/lipase superfamily enzyme